VAVNCGGGRGWGEKARATFPKKDDVGYPKWWSKRKLALSSPRGGHGLSNQKTSSNYGNERPGPEGFLRRPASASLTLPPPGKLEEKDPMPSCKRPLEISLNKKEKIGRNPGFSPEKGVGYGMAGKNTCRAVKPPSGVVRKGGGFGTASEPSLERLNNEGGRQPLRTPKSQRKESNEGLKPVMTQGRMSTGWQLIAGLN